MEQLLKITRVPIKYELKVHNARLEMKNGTAEFELSRDKNGLKIQGKPIKVHIDTFEARNSVVPTTFRANKQYAEKGRQAALEASANFAQEGRILMRSKVGEGGQTLDRIFKMRNEMPDGQFKLGFVPTTGPDISWEGPELSIEYEMDKLNFDWKVNKGKIEFIPGSIEMIISQHPELNIEYMGKPIYVPPSVAEHFEVGEHVNFTM